MAKVADDGWNDLVHITGTVWETCKEMRVKIHEELKHHVDKNNFSYFLQNKTSHSTKLFLILLLNSWN